MTVQTAVVLTMGALALMSIGCAKHIHVATPTPVGSGRNVVLNWTASTTANVTYNAYRWAGTCATAGAGVKLNASPITAVTYTDADVPTGTFCYWTTAWCQAAAVQESVPSNKVEVSIIQQPNPPQNLTITPPAVTMQTGAQQQFAANYPDAVWSISPADLGSITAAGLYTAPSSIKGNNVQVMVMAASNGQLATAQVTIRKN